jgi:tripartite ATP-independent transporter DctP family solute receptor
MVRPVLFLFLFLILLHCRPSISTNTIKIGLSHGKSHSFSQALERFKADVEEKSHGRFQVRIFHSSQMGGEKEMQEMLTLGSLDISVSGVLNTYEPLFTLFEMPYLYRDRKHVIQVNEGPLMQEVAQSLEKEGIVLVGFYENGFRNISTTDKKIEVPSDLAGLKIRTPENPAQIQTMKSLGAIATPLSFSELYAALVQGVVDGQENPLQNIWFGRLYETQKYIAITHHIYNSAYLIASKRFWDRLEVDDRQMIRAALKESSRWQMKYMEQLDRELEANMKKAGVTFTYPDQKKFEKATLSAYEAIYTQLGKEARELVVKIRETK